MMKATVFLRGSGAQNYGDAYPLFPSGTNGPGYRFVFRHYGRLIKRGDKYAPPSPAERLWS